MVFEHSRIQILRAMGHEVEAGHEEDHINEKEPVSLNGSSAFLEECICDVLSCFADSLTFNERVSLREEESEDDQENWWPCSKPEEWAPSVRRGVDEASCEDCCEQVPEGVSLFRC